MSERQQLTAEQALELAIQVHRSGELAMAHEIYTRILQAAPDYAEAHHFYGVFCHHTGGAEEAIAHLKRSLEIEPNQPAALSNFGNILSELGRPEAAAEAFERAIVLKPDNADALNNLGVVLRQSGRLDEAEAAYRKAIAADDQHRDAYNNLGRLLASRGRLEEAVRSYTRAMEVDPHHGETHHLLARAYTALGEVEKAKNLYRAWLDAEPDNPIAAHLFGACSGESVPARASDQYVETTFDRFAATFDVKLARLRYRAPDLVGAALAKACGTPARSLNIVDAGCGTGLCGPLLAPFAKNLAGVDLSAGMLAKAKLRGVYDDLVHQELVSYFDASRGMFDAIVSADTFCYFGELGSLFAAARAALRGPGLLIFTVEEEIEAPPFRLNPHGRYSHAGDYVFEELDALNFTGIEIERDTLRYEIGVPVAGLLVSARAAF